MNTTSSQPAKKRHPRKKHVPQRTCVGCRQVESKRSMIRVVRRPDGVFVDPKGKQAGRGAYLHADPACWARGLNGALERALKTQLTAEDRERLQAFAATLQTAPAEEQNA
ncbi:MAG: YlxR family protein [Anaerolineae bacterium]|nr:MAG: YlxR family protein [Anaerolineae bacterium]